MCLILVYAEKPMSGGHSTVLIVNDDRNLSEVVGYLLERRFAVEFAYDGKEALQKLRDGLAPCMILLDLMMPVMSGFEFRDEQLRDPNLARIPVIVFSAIVDLHAEHRERLRASAYAQIPDDTVRLPELIEAHCLK